MEIAGRVGVIVIVDFENFAVERGPGLVRLAHALTADFGLAEDLVQDVLLKAHRDWERISTLDAPDSYVRRMLTNEFLSWRRKWGRVVPVAQVWLRDQDDHAAVVAERDVLRAEVSRLPRRQQVVLALRYYGGLSDAEIAQALGCATGTVRAYASRALATLRIEPVFSRGHAAITSEKGSPV